MKRFFLIIFIICISIIMVGCKKASKYSEEEHIERVKKIIEEKYLEDNVSYKLTPIYDYEDKLAYFVVDFSNNTYFYIKINEKDLSFFWGPSMYVKDTMDSNSGPWKRSKFIEKDGQIIEEFEQDENGNDILYYNSHFQVANIDDDTKCYLIDMKYSGNMLIPAIKLGDEWLNLITMETFNIYSSYYDCESAIMFNVGGSFNL